MKKILMMIMLILTSFTLVSCDLIKKKPEVDNEDKTEDVLPEENEKEVEELVIELDLNKGFIDNLTGSAFKQNVEKYSILTISGVSTAYTTTGKPSRGNFFIKNIFINDEEESFNLNIGKENSDWMDGKEHIVDFIVFKDYQIREKYNAIGVRANHIDFENEGLITINLDRVTNISFDLFSSISNLNPDNLIITITLK